MATADKDHRAVARDAELDFQDRIRQAVYDVTHDKNGKAKVLVP